MEEGGAALLIEMEQLKLYLEDACFQRVLKHVIQFIDKTVHNHMVELLQHLNRKDKERQIIEPQEMFKNMQSFFHKIFNRIDHSANRYFSRVEFAQIK